MEYLQYIIEDSTIAELLGIQNFTNDESAVLELVKNAYDAKASQISLEYRENQLTIVDDGVGMDSDDIKLNWMHVGKSSKEYEVIDANNNKRILAGSKGVGRFALSRLGRKVSIYTKKDDTVGVVWCTDWNRSILSEDSTITEVGTKIVIDELREKWGKKKVDNLIDFLSKTYNDVVMKITVIHPEITKCISKYFPEMQVCSLQKKLHLY
jgi:HSP90 family molecular chaperone